MSWPTTPTDFTACYTSGPNSFLWEGLRIRCGTIVGGSLDQGTIDSFPPLSLHCATDVSCSLIHDGTLRTPEHFNFSPAPGMGQGSDSGSCAGLGVFFVACGGFCYTFI